MIEVSTWNDEEMAEELIETLEDMALQYLSDVDGNVMTHDFMIAGERCLGLLTALGKTETEDGIHYTWTEEVKREGVDPMMPISEINIGDIFSNPMFRGHDKWSGLEWHVMDKKKNMVKVQGHRFFDGTPCGKGIWRKPGSQLFSEAWKV